MPGGMKNTTSLSANMQMMECFREFVRPLDKDFTRQLAHYAQKFYAAQSINGYKPYMVGFGGTTATTTSPFYDELEGTEPIPIEEEPLLAPLCTDFDACPAPQHCQWPNCNHRSPKKATEADIQASKPWAPLTDSEATEGAIRNWYGLDETDPEYAEKLSSLKKRVLSEDPVSEFPEAGGEEAAIPQPLPAEHNNKLIINTETPETQLATS